MSIELLQIINIIVGIGTIVSLLASVFIFWGKYATKVNRNEKDISNLDGKLDDKISRLDSKLDKKFDTLNEKIFEQSSGLVKSDSPRHLTEKGQRISEAITADAIIERLYGTLFEKVIDNRDNPPNPYTIQETAMRVIRNNISALLHEDEILLLQDVAYHEGMSTDDLLPILGILLRNRILEEYKMTKDTIDTHEHS